jgi:hypothetical protein
MTEQAHHLPPPISQTPTPAKPPSDYLLKLGAAHEHATPSPQRGEGGVRGFGLGVFARDSEPPHPVLLPAGEKGRSLHAALRFWLGGALRKQSHSRGAGASEFCQSQVHEKPCARKATREWSAGRRRVVGHATRTDVATRSRFGRGARHRRSACANRLLRARCASRRSTTIAVLRRGCRPPSLEFRPRSAGRHRQPAI